MDTSIKDATYGIPIIGTASTPAELVAVLKRAVAERYALAEHEVDIDDRYTVGQAQHDRGVSCADNRNRRFIGRYQHAKER